MKKFFGKIARFAVRNLILMVCLVMLGIWAFPNNYEHYEYRGMNKSIQMLDMVESESYDARMIKPRRMMAPVASIASNVVFADVKTEDGKVIKNASLNIEVDDTEIARGLAEEKIKELKGVVTHMNSYSVRSRVLAYNMTLRVPSDKLDDAIINLVSLGIKKSENFSSNDITVQYFDTENKIKNLETRRHRLRELMAFKTDNLNDILQIDKELSSVQNQIENLQRTQNNRDTDVSFSTINLNIQPKPIIGDFSSPAEWNIEKTWKTSVNDLIHSLQDIAEESIKIIVYSPIWLPIFIVLWFIQKYIRKITDKKNDIFKDNYNKNKEEDKKEDKIQDKLDRKNENMIVNNVDKETIKKKYEKDINSNKHIDILKDMFKKMTLKFKIKKQEDDFNSDAEARKDIRLKSGKMFNLAYGDFVQIIENDKIGRYKVLRVDTEKRVIKVKDENNLNRDISFDLILKASHNLLEDE